MKNHINIYFFLFLLLFVAGFFFWYLKLRVPVADVGQTADELLESERFLAMVNKIRMIQIDTSFFSNEVFLSLKDLTPIIKIPDDLGRINPFSRL